MGHNTHLTTESANVRPLNGLSLLAGLPTIPCLLWAGPCKRGSAMNTSLFSPRETAILSRLLNKAAPVVAKANKTASTPVEARKLAQATVTKPEPKTAARKASSGLKLASDLLPMASTLDELPDCLSW